MASVDGEYIGPLTTEDAQQIIDDLQAGRPVLPDKQLRYRKCADPGVAEGASEFAPRDDAPRADTAGLSDETEDLDRPGPTAPVELTAEEASEQDEDDAS
jgi:hypothetical protein